MEISVIIPTYRPEEKYMLKCLDSLFLQTLDHSLFEVIVILNGCDQPYRSMIEKLVSRYGCGMDVRLVQTDEPGQSNARNIGLDICSSRYVCFIDYDDWISERYLESMYMSVREGSVVQSNVVSVADGTGEEYPDYIGGYYRRLKGFQGKISKRMGVHFLSNTATKLIPSEMIGAVRYKDIRIGEDALFMASISDRITAVELAGEEAVYYRRIHPNSLLHSNPTLGWWFSNRCRLTLMYLKTYFSNIREYDAWIFIHRILAIWRFFFRQLFNIH